MAALLGLRPRPSPSKVQGDGGALLMKGDYPSLFAPDSEEDYSSDSDSAREEQTRPSLLPLEEVIIDAPKTLNDLLEILLPRLQPRAEVKGVSMEDQQNLATILIGELSSQFLVLHQQIDDPFMTHHQNKQLHKQITVQVCKIIEGLYTQYVTKAANVDREGVLSVQANLSRLRAQLTVEANKSLNIPVIRRHLLSQHRSNHPLSTEREHRPPRLPPLPTWRVEKKAPPKPATSLEQLKLDEPLKVKMQRFGVRLESRAVKRKIKRLQSKFPVSSQGAGLQLQSADQYGVLLADSESSDVEEEEPLLPTFPKSFDMTTTPHVGLRRVSSLPELGVDSLLCDFGLVNKHQRLEMKYSRSGVLGIKRPPSIDSFMDLKLEERDPRLEKGSTKLGDYTLEDLSKDLHNLKTTASDSGGAGLDELNPLLQAHVHGLSEKNSRRLEEFEAELMRQLWGEQPEPPQRMASQLSLEESIPSVSTMEQLPSLPYIPHESGSSHQSMLVKSGFSMRSGGSTDKQSITSSRESGDPGSLAEVDNDSVFRERSLSDFDMQHPSATVTPRLGTRVSLGHTATYTSLLGESRLTFEDLRQQSVPTIVFDVGEHGYTPGGDDDNDGDEGEEHFETTPTPGEQIRQDIVGRSHSTLRASRYSFGFDLDLQGDEIGPTEDSSTKGQSLEKVATSSEEHHVTQPQPAVIATRINEREVVRTTDIRVSERTPLADLRLKSFEPIYNELTGELSSGMIEELDTLLHSGTEIAAVYEELTKTLPTDHLDFVNESTLEPSIEQQVDLSTILASNTLHHRRSRRIVNPQLYRNIPHPWGEETSREQWQLSNQYHGPDLAQYGIKAGSGKPLSPRLAHIARKYHTWLIGWRSTINSEDYLKFASREESDYLHLIYHLYDSDGSDSEAEEEEKQRRARLAAMEAKLKSRELRRQQRYHDKSHYQPGVWNVNTVMMGGLGGDPELSSSSDEDIDQDPSLLPPQQDVQVSHEVQRRLQAIWRRLQCTERQQMDMAIKYSSSHLSSLKVNETLTLWEESCDMIEEREAALMRLETFERAASDPTRFFLKGHQGSSVLRLEEARKRDQLHKELDKLDAAVSRMVHKLQMEHGDIISFKGRPYYDKMRFDRTEMLYWLQQERRQSVLKPALTTLKSSSIATTELSLPTITPALNTENLSVN